MSLGNAVRLLGEATRMQEHQEPSANSNGMNLEETN
jgi:hypothetical protein